MRERLTEAVLRLRPIAAALRHELDDAQTVDDLEKVRRRLLDFRRRYARVETAVDFYADAINTRTSREVAALLRACDVIAGRSMAIILGPLGKSTPPVLCYLDKGLGASVLKAGLRLWDGTTENPAATIKVVWHNLFRPTSLIHEAGHQVAHILGWNEEFAAALENGLAPHGREIAQVWVGWTSEVAADAFAFAHSGYAAVAALHDVLAETRTRSSGSMPMTPTQSASCVSSLALRCVDVSSVRGRGTGSAMLGPRRPVWPMRHQRFVKSFERPFRSCRSWLSFRC